jgi:hypothetical protein
MGPVVFQRRRRVDVREHPGARLELLPVEPAGDTHHLHGILDAFLAQGVGLERLVGQRQQIEYRVKMANGRVDIDGFHGIAAVHVDAIETLGELQQVLKVLPVAAAPAVVQVRNIGRAGNLTERRMTVSDDNPAFRIARRDAECRRRPGHLLHDERPVHPHIGRAGRHLAAGILENLPGFVVQKFDADLLQNPHGGIVHALDTLGIQRFRRWFDITQLAPGELVDGRRRFRRRPVLLPPPRPAAEWLNSVRSCPLVPVLVEIENYLAGRPGVQGLEPLFEILEGQPVGDDGADIQPAAQHGDGLVPGLEHLPAIDALDSNPLENRFVQIHRGRFPIQPQERQVPAVHQGANLVRQGVGTAGHFQADIETLPHAQLAHHILQIDPVGPDRATGTHLHGQRQTGVVDIGDDDMVRADMPRHGGGHDADGARAGNQYILAHQVE